MGADNQAAKVIAVWDDVEKFVREILVEMNGHEPDEETVRDVRAKIVKVLREVRPDLKSDAPGFRRSDQRSL